MSKFYLQNQRFIVEVEGYNGSSITGLRMKRNNIDPEFDVLGWTDWIEFESVNLDPLNEWDGGYIGSHETKFVGFTVSTPGVYQGMNFIVFAPDPVPQDQTITTDIMLLTSDWNMFEQTYFLSTESVSEVNFHLEGHWSFDSDATDSANGYNGTVTAGSFESDVGRDFISFERESTGIVSLPDSLDSIVAGDYTMSAWVRLDTLQDTDFGYFGVMTINGVGLSVTLGYPSITSNGGDTTHHFPGVGLMSVDTWHHLVLVQEGSDSKLYLDGVLLGTNPTQPSNAWGIGTDNNVAKGYSPFGGDIDNLQIYSMALSPDQVGALYDSTTVTPPAADPSISIALPANPIFGQPFEQTLDLQGASEYVVNWEFYDYESSSWLPSFDANNDRLVDYRYQLSDVRAVLVVGEQSYYSNVVSVPEFLLSYEFLTDVSSASAGDTIQIRLNRLGYEGAIVWAKIYQYDDIVDYNGWVEADMSVTADPNIFEFTLGFDRSSKFLFPSIKLDGGEIADFYAGGSFEQAPDLSGDLVPLQKYGYKPVFLTEVEANLWPAGDNTSHSHSLGGVTYFMPGGLNMDPNNGPITQWHGTWGLFMQHDGDDEVADVGTTPATYTNVSSATVAGRAAWSYTGQDSYVSFESDRPDLSGDWTISMWFNGLSSVEDYRTAARCYGVDHPILLMPDGRLGTWQSSNTTFHDSGATLNPSSLSGWNHIVAVGSGTSTVFYVNGVSVGTSSYKTSDSLYSVGNHVFADGQPNSAVSGNQLWADHISGVKVYSRAIDSEEVQYWYAEEYVADPDGPQTLSVEQFDSYGDGWNGGQVVVSDADGNVVGTFIGPANGVKLPEGLTESMTLANDALYSYVVTLGSYPTEITWNIKDSSGATLVSWSNGDSATGTFTLGTPPLYPGMTGDYYATADAGTIEFVNTQSNADGITAGATQWAYSTSPLGEVGQAHGGTAVDFGNLTLTGLPESSSLTLYFGLIDAYGVVIWKSSLAENTLAKIQHTLTMWDSYGDGWDGTYFEIYDSNGATVFSTTRPVATLDNDGDGDIDNEDGKYPYGGAVLLPEGDYTWALVGGAYPEEHSFTFVRTSDDLSLAASTASDVTSGSFTASNTPIDSTTPVITLLGDSPMTLTVGDSYVEPGATAVDDVDGVLEVTISGNENITSSDDWIAYSGYNMSAPTIEGELLISGGSYGHNYLARKENDILPQTDFEIVVEFEDVTLPWAQYEPELRLRVDFLENAYSAEIKMQAYSAWGASNTFFSGFRQQHNSGQTYSGQTSGGSLVQTGAFKVVREGSTVTMYRREGSEGEFVQMSSATSANYAGAARIIVGFMNTPGRITSVSRTDIQTGAILGDYTVSYSATDAAGNTATVNRSVSVAAAGVADFLHGLDVRLFVSAKTSNSSRSEAYIHKHNGQMRLSLSSNVLEAPSIHIDLGAVDAASVTNIFDGMIAIGLEDGDIKVVKIEDSSAEIIHTISDPSINGLSKVIKNGNHSGPGGSLVFFDNDGNIFFSPTIDANGNASGTITSPSIDIPALAHGNKTHIVDAEAGAGVLVAITRSDDGGGKEMFAWDMSSENQILLGSIPISDVWEINYVYNELLGTYSWIAANAAGETASTSDILSWI